MFSLHLSNKCSLPAWHLRAGVDSCKSRPRPTPFGKSDGPTLYISIDLTYRYIYIHNMSLYLIHAIYNINICLQVYTFSYALI